MKINTVIYAALLPLFLSACAVGPNVSKLEREGQLNRYADTHLPGKPSGYWLLDSTYYGEQAQYLYEYKNGHRYKFYVRKDGQNRWLTSGYMQSDGTHRWLAKDLAKVRDDRFVYEQRLAKGQVKQNVSSAQVAQVAQLEGQHLGALRNKLHNTIQAKVAVLKSLKEDLNLPVEGSIRSLLG